MRTDDEREKHRNDVSINPAIHGIWELCRTIDDFRTTTAEGLRAFHKELATINDNLVDISNRLKELSK